eukprot:g26398.t1
MRLLPRFSRMSKRKKDPEDSSQDIANQLPLTKESILPWLNANGVSHAELIAKKFEEEELWGDTLMDLFNMGIQTFLQSLNEFKFKDVIGEKVMTKGNQMKIKRSLENIARNSKGLDMNMFNHTPSKPLFTELSVFEKFAIEEAPRRMEPRACQTETIQAARRLFGADHELQPLKASQRAIFQKDQEIKDRQPRQSKEFLCHISICGQPVDKDSDEGLWCKVCEKAFHLRCLTPSDEKQKCPCVDPNNDHFKRSFLGVLPTGSGKTKLFALLPFALGSLLKLQRVMFLTTNGKDDLIAEYESLKNKGAFPKFLGEEFAVRFVRSIPKIAEAEPRRGASPDILIVNIQKAVDAKDGRISLREMIKNYNPDIVLVDEAHHAEAPSWKILLKELSESVLDKEKQIIFMTATPLRGDNTEFETFLKCRCQYYLYSRRLAEAEKIIKRTTPCPVGTKSRAELEEELKELQSKEDNTKHEKKGKTAEKNEKEKRKTIYMLPQYFEPLFEEAKKQLDMMRVTRHENEKPFMHRVLGVLNETHEAEFAAEEWNKWKPAHNGRIYRAGEAVRSHPSHECLISGSGQLHKAWFASLSCGLASIHGGMSKAKQKQILDRFDETGEKYGQDSIDVLFNCRLLGEGYNNKALSIILLLAPPQALQSLSQIAGRALRFLGKDELGDQKLDHNNNTARLIYPQWKDIEAVVERYMNCEDENAENILKNWVKGTETLSELHSKFRMQQDLSGNVAERYRNIPELRQAYDNALEKQLEANGNDYPTVVIAEKLILAQIEGYDEDEVVRILDFGSADGRRLQRHLEKKLQNKAIRCTIELYCIDYSLTETSSSSSSSSSSSPAAAAATECKEIRVRLVQANFCNDTEVKSALREKGWPESAGEWNFADFAIFSQSLMTTDCNKGLEVAAALMKPESTLYLAFNWDTFAGGRSKFDAQKMAAFGEAMAGCGWQHVKRNHSGNDKYAHFDMIRGKNTIDFDKMSRVPALLGRPTKNDGAPKSSRDLKNLNKKMLEQLCRDNKVNAKGSVKVLRERLAEHFGLTLYGGRCHFSWEVDEPSANDSAPAQKKKPSSKRTAKRGDINENSGFAEFNFEFVDLLLTWQDDSNFDSDIYPFD